MNVLRLAGSPWARVLFSAVALLSSTLCAFGTEETAADRVNSLRMSLREDQRAYLRALGENQSTAFSAQDYIAILRADLKSSVSKLLKAAGGGEVELAYRTSTVKFRLNVIHAYEDALGDRRLARTTEWNVFSSDDLRTLNQEARTNFKNILQSALTLPEAEVPLTLLNRVRELKGQLGGLERELFSRVGGREPELRTIKPGISLSDARARYASIAAVDGPGATKSAEHILKFEVAVRSGVIPRNASLERLKDLVLWIPGIDPHIGPGPRDPPHWPTDPPSHPTGGTKGGPRNRGPPLADIPAQLKNQIFREFRTITERKTLDRIQTQTDISTLTKFLGIALQQDNLSPFTVLDQADLDRVRDGYINWHKNLLQEQDFDNSSIELLKEIKEASRIRDEIASEYKRREKGSPLFGNARFKTALKFAGESAQVLAFRISYETYFKSELTKLLRIELDIPKLINDPRIKSYYEEALVLRFQSEVEQINTLWETACHLELEVLRNGRGPIGAHIGSSIVGAKRDIQMTGKQLMKRIENTFPNGTRPIDLVPLNPNILAPTENYGAAGSSVERAVATLIEVSSQASRLDGAHSQPYVHIVSDNGKAEIVGIRTLPPTSEKKHATRLSLEANYDQLFPREEKWTQDFKKLTEETIESLRRAPGGVIVDPNLTDSLRKKIQALRIDLNENVLQMRSENSWKTILPQIDAETLRLAYAFVLDARVAAVDLRTPVGSELNWLISTWMNTRKSPAEPADVESLSGVLRSLNSVNLHPCLANTTIGLALIQADQLVFDLLPIANVRREFDELKSGMSLTRLRELYAEDSGDALRDERYSQALFYKSILLVREVFPRRGFGINSLRAQFDFRVYHVPIRYQRSGAWFDQNQEALIVARPELEQLTRFALAVAVCRAVQTGQLPNNFDILASVECRKVRTPRFTIMRSDKLDWKADVILKELLVPLSGNIN